MLPEMIQAMQNLETIGKRNAGYIEARLCL